MKRIGLTGGIATGKSTVLQHWQREGRPAVAIIETDELAHRALEPATPTYQAVVQQFGNGILNPDRTINRRELGRIVFGDEAKRTALNAIIHPAVRKAWESELRRLESNPVIEFVVVSIPLLYEVGAENEFDCVVAVGCSEQTQLARLAKKGFSESDARARIAAQLPIQTKIDRADYAIWNDGTLPVLTEQADIIWATIKEMSYAPSKN